MNVYKFITTVWQQQQQQKSAAKKSELKACYLFM